MNLDDAQVFLHHGGFDYVRFEQTDLHGLTRAKTVPSTHFREFAENGLNFFGGTLGFDPQSGVAPDTGYMAERHFQDHLLRPDLNTLAPIPWLQRTARVLAEPSWFDGTPAEAAPRFLLRRMLDRLSDRGYALRSGFEYELYFARADTREPVFEGLQIFWTLRNDFDPPFMMRLLDGLRATGIDIITSNAEYGPGQMEINFAPSMGVAAADRAFIFKNAVKEMAQQGIDGRRYLASFMSKPYADCSASGGHYHHSLLQRESGANAFYDAEAEDGLSAVARHWIGGQLAHAGALAAFCAPTVNCAKRYKLWSFAPMNATWGYEDRTTAVRVKGGRGAETRLENRMPCSSANPYLAAAAIIAASLDGMAREIEPPPPTPDVAYGDESAPKLPQRLEDSLEALEQDTALREYLGEEFIKLFCAVKRFEIERAKEALPEYSSAEWPDTVTEWERQNFFEYL